VYNISYIIFNMSYVSSVLHPNKPTIISVHEVTGLSYLKYNLDTSVRILSAVCSLQ